MSRVLPTILTIAFVALIFVSMYLSWRRRTIASRTRVQPTHLGTESKLVLTLSNVLYVVTNPVGDPYTRFAVKGLMHRGRGSIQVRTDGLVVSVVGEEPVAIQNEQILRVQPQQYTVGKVVEKDGLLGITWLCDEHEVTSVFRGVTEEAQRQLTALGATLTQAGLTNAIDDQQNTDKETGTLQ